MWLDECRCREPIPGLVYLRDVRTGHIRVGGNLVAIEIEPHGQDWSLLGEYGYA